MRAVVVEAYGGADRMAVREVPKPEAGPGAVRLRIVHAGINFIDVYMRSGVFRHSDTYGQSPPMILGMEGVGFVGAVGDGVDEWAEGDAVAYCLELGSYAEFAVVPAWKLVKVPDGVPLDVAAALQLQGSTAHYLSHSLFPLKPSGRCLIHTAAGGMGQLLIQLAKLRGAAVFATVGSAEKADIARARGTDHVILYHEVDFAEAVLDLTADAGIDVVYDPVGRDTIEGSLRRCRRRGTVSNTGNASGPIGAIDPLVLAEAGSLFFTRPHLADYMATAEERCERARELFALWRDGKLIVTIDRVLPLDRARTAHETIESRETRGKQLLDAG